MVLNRPPGSGVVLRVGAVGHQPKFLSPGAEIEGLSELVVCPVEPVRRVFVEAKGDPFLESIPRLDIEAHEPGVDSGLP